MGEKPDAAPLKRLYEALDWVRKEQPDLTLTGLLTLLWVAHETNSGDVSRIPLAMKVGEALGMTGSSASRLLDSLGDGRVRDGERGEGLGLIVSDDEFLNRRSKGYVLTKEGRTFVENLLRRTTGESPWWFMPLDREALQHLLFRGLGKRPTRKAPKR